SWKMDPHRIVWAVMVGLLGATRLSSGGRANCTCPKIPPKNFTVQKDGCFKVTYRYECIPGYTRKPGTSNLIRCQEKNGVSQWAESKFECITDPNYRPPPTTTRGRKPLFFSLSLHNFCPLLSVCKNFDLRPQTSVQIPKWSLVLFAKSL
uniref:Sushi domain-containing protein n=1 Tax=Poecilia reticulata TaxID=8081 RepID=A0A3P9PX45_POERE